MSGEDNEHISVCRSLKWGEVGTLMLALVSGMAIWHLILGDEVSRAHVDEAQVRSELHVRLPKTPVTSVDCKTVGGLCEVISGPNVFYTDPSTRYLIVGRVYDLETRSDLTAARLLEMSPDTLARGAPKAQDAARAAQAPGRIDPTSLPRQGAVAWGPKDGPRVVVFADLACPYCRMLHQTLAALGTRVEEYPIAILGSRPLAEQVLCARDPAKALAGVYGGDRAEDGPRRPGCDTRLIDANEAFFQAQGWQGTPVLIRADGDVREGALEATALKAWLTGGRA